MSDNNTNVNDTTKTADEEKKQKKQQQSESKLKKQIEGEAKSKAKGLTKKGVKKATEALFQSVTASTGVAIFGVIIVVFMLIGIAAFILTMPGMVQDKIHNTFDSIITSIVEDTFMGGEEHIVSTDELNDKAVEALQHLNKMGLDPVGLGFAHYVNKNEEGEITSFNDLGSYLNFFKTNGEWAVDEVPTACPLLSYVIAEEKTYLPKEYYVKSENEAVPLYLFWNINPNGVIIGGNVYAKRDNGMLDFDTSGVDVDIELDRATKSMTYSNTRMFNGSLEKQSYTVGLENWIGRYGKPLELLIALHIATMTSDIPEEFATNDELQTDVKITFQEGTYDMDFKLELKNSDGTTTELPIKFGEFEDNNLISLLNTYKCIQSVYNDESGTYEYKYVKPTNAGGDYTKDAVTICSLKHLIDNISMVETYIDGEVQEKYESSYEILDSGLGEILNGNNDIYLKYDINMAMGSEQYAQTGAYIGTRYEQNGKQTYTGILSDDGTCTHDLGPGIGWNTTGIAYEYGITDVNGVTVGHGGGSNADKMYVDLSPDADATKSRAYKKVNSLKNYAESSSNLARLNRSVEEKDVITCLMLEIDQYLYDKSVDYDDDFVHVRYNGNNHKVSIDYGGASAYVMDFSNNNYLINYGSGYTDNPDMPGTITKKWLTYINQSGGITSDNMNSLIDQINIYYGAVHNLDLNIKTVLDGIWCDLVDSEATECPLSAEDIQNIYDILYDYTKGMQDIKMAYPRIETVTHHWFKDLDFTGAYDKAETTIPVSAYDSEDSDIVITALLTNKEHMIQTSQPYVIKGDVVTLDGEVQEDYDLNTVEHEEFGKGYEASKKLLTAGYYYVYDGSEATSNGIVYSKLLENVKGGNMVMVRVGPLGNIVIAKVLNHSGSVFSLDNMTIATATGGGVNWNIAGEELSAAGCAILKIGNEQNTTDEGEAGEGEEDLGEDTQYYVYIPEDVSLKYISSAESEQGAKESAERINELLMALGVGSLRKQVSFDNATSDGDVVTLTAFSILEGMKTDTAQTIYRELKEFLIDLGYYTKAEFEYLNNDVLEWFIPDYIPDDPVHWQQNKNEDVLLYGAILYPQSEFGNSEETEDGEAEDGETPEEGESGDNDQEEPSENEGEDGEEGEDAEQESEEEKIRETGFEPDLDVIAPGNARILEYSNDAEDPYITLEFDGITQPEIAMLDRYVMTIKGITVNTMLTDPDEEDEEEDEDDETGDEETEDGEVVGTSIDTIVEEGTTIKAKTVIGKTGTKKIQVILKNSKGAILNNVEDYMAPDPFIDMSTDIQLSNDYNVFTDSNENVIRDVEQFKELFSECQVIVDNADAFMEMQETYKVNAVFAAAVCMTESSAGTNGNLVGKGSANRNDTGYPYNMFSITYWGDKALSKKTFKWTNSAASNWMAYDSFEQAILDFGNYIANSRHYFNSNKYKVSEIAATYCPPGDEWADAVSTHMTEKLKLLLEGN